MPLARPASRYRSAVTRPRRRLGLLAAFAAVVAVACQSTSVTPSSSLPSGFSPTPWATNSSAQATATSNPTVTPTPQPTAPPQVPLAIVVRFDSTRPSISAADVTSAAAAGSLLVPCQVTALSLGGKALTLPSAATCTAADQITATVHNSATAMGLLPAGLVTPSVKVLPIGDADLFGSPKHRALPYPLQGTVADGATFPAYNVGDIRTLISTGDTCPDRGVSHQTVVLGKGWNWALDGGYSHYTGFFEHPWGWPVPYISRNGDTGKISDLISDNDVSANDFECPMLTNWKQHEEGTVFNIDPKVAQLLATKGGLKAVTLGSNHITDGGVQGLKDTLAYLDAAGIKHTGAGMNITEALAPAVVDVRGVKFAFVGWDDIAGSGVAGPNTPGVALLNDQNVCSSIKAARQVADVVIAMPQWGWPEYHNDITAEQRTQRQFFYDCGADDILGSGTHWASWVSVLPGANGPQFAIGSHGNFLFGQNWSRQTMEGVVVEATFSATKLVQFRLHPYVVVDQAQPNLLDPTTDGKYVLNQVWSVSDVR